MLQDVRKLLPIGSVVLLKEGSKPLMIIGIRQTDPDTNQDYDYMGVFYPEGHMGNEYRFIFNHDGIAEVLFTGYDTPERAAFLERLHAYLEKQ